MPLPTPNRAPNQVLIKTHALQGYHPPNKTITQPVTAVANAAGTTTTLVGANGQSPSPNIGDRVRLYTSANVLKQTGLFTITNKAVAVSTTWTFTPAAGGATASGDYLSVSEDVSLISVPANYIDIASIDVRLAAINGTLYTQARLNSMTLNDKLYALRLSDDAEMGQ